jgi:nucleoporin POM152
VKEYVFLSSPFLPFFLEKANSILRKQPWTVTYQPPSRSSGTPLAPITFRAQQANVDINIASALPGAYKLLSVRDRFCPGDVFETDWSVETLPRPSLKLGDGIGKVARNGSVVRKGVCANVADSFPVYFEGKAPFRASYTLSKNGGGEKKDHVLQAIQSRADLTLFTAAPGHHTYHFHGVGDSLYTTPEAAGLVSPSGGKSGLLRVEQDVFALPTAYFAHGPKHGFCLNDELKSRGGDDLVLHLTGTAPFEVELEVKEAGQSSKPSRFTVPSIKGNEWPVSLPVALNKATTHSISIKRVKDAHGCETVVDPSSSAVSSSSSALSTDRPSTITLTVSEIATITPVTPQKDHCVGDVLSFVVQGSPPFTVKSEFEGKKHTVPLSTGKFERVAAKPGVFRVLSVGQGEEECKSNEVDMCVFSSSSSFIPSFLFLSSHSSSLSLFLYSLSLSLSHDHFPSTSFHLS